MTVEAESDHAGRPADVTELRQRFDAEVAAFIERQDLDHAGAAPAGGPADFAGGWSDFAGGRSDSVGGRSDLVGAVRAFALTGGKRLRPLFCYWGWRAAGRPDGRPIVTAAAALELFQAFALIHDDIMDGSDRRRGAPALHRVHADRHAHSGWRGESAAFGRHVALLVGNLCLAWSARMFLECGLPPAEVHRGYRVYAAMRTEAIAGQYLDLASAAGAGSMARALTVIRLKAARYTVTRPLQIGAALAGAPPQVLAALVAFGDPLGDAFQLRDDVLGVFGDPALTGKSVLDDLREGKPTVLMALTRDNADAGQARRLQALFGRSDLDDAGAAELRGIIVETGALTRIEQMITRRSEAALAVLDGAPFAVGTRAVLADLVTTAVHREQ